MADERDEIIPMYEATEISWRQYLAEFDEKVWPIFQFHGYTKDTALLSWTLDKIRTELEELNGSPP